MHHYLVSLIWLQLLARTMQVSAHSCDNYTLNETHFETVHCSLYTILSVIKHFLISHHIIVFTHFNFNFPKHGTNVNVINTFSLLRTISVYSVHCTNHTIHNKPKWISSFSTKQKMNNANALYQFCLFHNGKFHLEHSIERLKWVHSNFKMAHC